MFYIYTKEKNIIGKIRTGSVVTLMEYKITHVNAHIIKDIKATLLKIVLFLDLSFNTITLQTIAMIKNIPGVTTDTSSMWLPKSHAQKNAPIHARAIFMILLCITTPLLNFLNYISKFGSDQYIFDL